MLWILRQRKRLKRQDFAAAPRKDALGAVAVSYPHHLLQRDFEDGAARVADQGRVVVVHVADVREGRAERVRVVQVEDHGSVGQIELEQLTLGEASEQERGFGVDGETGDAAALPADVATPERPLKDLGAVKDEDEAVGRPDRNPGAGRGHHCGQTGVDPVASGRDLR